LVTVLAAAACAVLGGARSYVAIAEWARDLPVSVRLRLGMGRSTPSESTFRRILQSVDADELDTAVSGWLARRAAAPGADQTGSSSTGSSSTGSGPVRAIALDGKTARGARRADGRAVHLLGALDHASGVVLGQTEVDAKTNEITAFTPLLERTDQTCPLAGAVITADALHTQDRHAHWLHEHGAHYVFIVKGNRPTLAAQLTDLPWQQVPVVDDVRGRGHGRVETRTLQLCAVTAVRTRHLAGDSGCLAEQSVAQPAQVRDDRAQLPGPLDRPQPLDLLVLPVDDALARRGPFGLVGEPGGHRVQRSLDRGQPRIEIDRCRFGGADDVRGSGPRVRDDVDRGVGDRRTVTWRSVS
jgi:hypothetical protein